MTRRNDDRTRVVILRSVAPDKGASPDRLGTKDLFSETAATLDS